MRSRSRRRWCLQLGVIALVGLAVRLYYIHVHKQHIALLSDAFYYHNGANLLAEGHGFVDPVYYALAGRSVPGAIHPPGFIVALALPSFVGFKSFLAHQVFAAFMSTATIVVVGLIGRRLAGPRTGLVAAGIAAIYPNFFFSDALLMSETAVLLTGAVTLLMAYRFWEHPSLGRAAALGVACGVTALSRSETVLLIPLLIVPIALLLRQLAWRRRLGFLAMAGASALATMAPWVTFNLVRFEHPVVLSIADPTLLAGNCRDTYYGRYIGYWSVPCITRVGGKNGQTLRQRLIDQNKAAAGDESTQGLRYRREALRFIRRNLGRVPFVVFAREGRTFGFYKPNQQLVVDQLAPREIRLNRLALWMYYALVVCGIPGVVILRRRRVPAFPLFALVVSVVLTVAVSIGETRYRALAEVPLVLVAAVAIDAAVTRLHPRRWRRARAGRLEGQPPDKEQAPEPAGELARR